jgi:hypothetical protein
MKNYVNANGYLIGAFNDEEKAKQLGYIEVNELPSGNLFSPIWNGTQWIESATPEEIEQAKRLNIPETITAIPFFVQLELMGITESDVINKI